MTSFAQWTNLEDSLNPFQIQFAENSKSQLSNQQQNLIFQNYAEQFQSQKSKIDLSPQTIMDSLFNNIKSPMDQEDDGSSLMFESFNQSDKGLHKLKQNVRIKSQTKGLKNLTQIIIQRFLESKIGNSSTRKQMIEQIESFLSKKYKLTKKSIKNIKRRIYDILNVLIATNVISQELQLTVNIHKFFKKKQLQFIGKTEQIQKKILQRQKRIKLKKVLLDHFSIKKQVLQSQFRDKQPRLAQKQQNQKNYYIQKNYNISQDIEKQNQLPINFPIIFISTEIKQVQSLFEDFTNSNVIMNINDPKIKVFSNIDINNIMKFNQEIKDFKQSNFFQLKSITEYSIKQQVQKKFLKEFNQQFDCIEINKN